MRSLKKNCPPCIEKCASYWSVLDFSAGHPSGTDYFRTAESFHVSYRQLSDLLNVTTNLKLTPTESDSISFPGEKFSFNRMLSPCCNMEGLAYDSLTGIRSENCRTPIVSVDDERSQPLSEYWIPHLAHVSKMRSIFTFIMYVIELSCFARSYKAGDPLQRQD